MPQRLAARRLALSLGPLALALTLFLWPCLPTSAQVDAGLELKLLQIGALQHQAEGGLAALSSGSGSSRVLLATSPGATGREEQHPAFLAAVTTKSSCTVTLTCNTGGVVLSCSSASGNCSSTATSVTCDGQTQNCPVCSVERACGGSCDPVSCDGFTSCALGPGRAVTCDGFKFSCPPFLACNGPLQPAIP